MTWRSQVKGWAVLRGRQARQYVHRVSAQAMVRARLSGQRVASRVLAVQRAAGLPEKMISQSARSVTERPVMRPADAAFRQGYGATIAAAMRPAEPVAADVPAAGWPFVPADPEAGS